MLREHNKLIIQIHKTLDITLTILAFVGAYIIKKDLLPIPYRGLITAPNYYIVLLLIIIIWYLVFRFFDLYASYRKQSFGRIFWNMAKAVFVSFLLLSFFMYLFKISDVSRIMMGIFYFLNALYRSLHVSINAWDLSIRN